ncbi:MAG: hypothetical protein ACRD8O_07405 [Bryobacteraceae bacterium]
MTNRDSLEKVGRPRGPRRPPRPPSGFRFPIPLRAAARAHSSRRRPFLTALLLLALPAFPADEALPKADTILDRYIEVTGGRAAYEKIKSSIEIGSVEFIGKGLKGMVTLFQAAPNRSYVSIELEGIGKMEVGSDGNTAWEKNAITGPRVKSGEERTAALRESDMHSLVMWRNHFKKAETSAVETIDGKVCYKVIVTPGEGKPETRFYDKQSGLLVRKEIIVKSPMGEVPGEIMIGDYKKVGDILRPHFRREKALNMELVTQIQSITQNVEIPPGKFALPDEVKALVARPASK